MIPVKATISFSGSGCTIVFAKRRSDKFVFLSRWLCVTLCVPCEFRSWRNHDFNPRGVNTIFSVQNLFNCDLILHLLWENFVFNNIIKISIIEIFMIFNVFEIFVSMRFFFKYPYFCITQSCYICVKTIFDKKTWL